MKFQNIRWRNGDFIVGKRVIYFKDYLLETEDPVVIRAVRNMPEFVEINSTFGEEQIDKILPKKKTIRGARTSIEEEGDKND